MADTDTEVAEVWEDFHALVNMTSPELRDWLVNTPDGVDTYAPEPDLDVHALGLRVLQLLSKRRTDLTSSDVDLMREVADLIHSRLRNPPEADVNDVIAFVRSVSRSWEPNRGRRLTSCARRRAFVPTRRTRCCSAAVTPGFFRSRRGPTRKRRLLPSSWVLTQARTHSSQRVQRSRSMSMSFWPCIKRSRSASAE